MNANPTTGYTWINNVDTSSHVEVTEDTFQQSENKNHLLGVGGQEYITIQANESGQFVFKAIQARPWQFDKTIFGDEHLFDGTYDVAVKINIA
jgi:predicted secreted protein